MGITGLNPGQLVSWKLVNINVASSLGLPPLVLNPGKCLPGFKGQSIKLCSSVCPGSKVNHSNYARAEEDLGMGLG